MKKNFLAFFLLAVLGVTPAAHAVWRGNWLVGVSASDLERRGVLDMDLLYPVPALFILAPATILEDLNDTGVVWSVLGGYQWHCENWRWGAELNMDWRDIAKTHSFVFPDLVGLYSWNAQARYQQGPFILGLTGKFGYQMASFFMAYMIAGFETFEGKFTTTFSGSQAYPFGISTEVKRRQYNIILGFGAEFSLPCISQAGLRVEYDYYSPDGNMDFSEQILQGGPNPLFEGELHSRTQAGKIALVWNFR